MPGMDAARHTPRFRVALGAVVTAALLVPLAVYGAPAIAKSAGSAAHQYGSSCGQYGSSSAQYQYGSSGRSVRLVVPPVPRADLSPHPFEEAPVGAARRLVEVAECARAPRRQAGAVRRPSGQVAREARAEQQGEAARRLAPRPRLAAALPERHPARRCCGHRRSTAPRAGGRLRRRRPSRDRGSRRPSVTRRAWLHHSRVPRRRRPAAPSPSRARRARGIRRRRPPRSRLRPTVTRWVARAARGGRRAAR